VVFHGTFLFGDAVGEKLKCGKLKFGQLFGEEQTVTCKRDRSGFTLLEILVAMAILMVIVLMMATLFHQSSIAWESGLRQAEMTMQARAAISLLRRDLTEAIAADDIVEKSPDGGLQAEIANGASGLSFWRYGEPDRVSGERALRRVEYWLAGDQLMREESSVKTTPQSATTFGRYVQGTPGPLLGNVSSFVIRTPNGYSNTGTNLPAWVEVAMTLEHDSVGAAAIKVWSNGRDNVFDTEDDKKLRLRTWRD